MHEDDRDEPGTVWGRGDERGPFPQHPAEPAKESERLELDDWQAGEREGQGRRRLVLDRDLLAADRDRLRGPGEVDREGAREWLSLHQGLPGRWDPEKRGERHLEPRSHQVATGL